MKKEERNQLRQMHPTPQWMREHFLSLDGEWKLNNHTVQVPYPPQSKQSGYGHHVGFHLHYQKEFTIPKEWKDQRILLHFGAVDQVCDIYVNEHFVGHHEGGYLAFHFDITEVCHGDKNRLIVAATDRLSHVYPYGKQRFARGGMWYTPVSGIWKTVWLEAVPTSYLASVKLEPDMEGFTVSYESASVGNAVAFVEPPTMTIYVPGEVPGEMHEVTVPLEPEATYISMRRLYSTLNLAWKESEVLWAPEHPNLFELTFRYGADQVMSYVAMRSISIQEVKGIRRVCLNGSPIFLCGVLDQGYFPEGIYVPKDPRAYEKDLQNMKDLGFQLVRKHLKVEPESFYYAADRIGMLVMQDMVNSGPYNFLGDTLAPNITFKKRSDMYLRHTDRKRKHFFIQHCKDTVTQLYNHPSIIAYTVFNEGWGQFESDRLYQLMKSWDAHRLVDATSGWFAQKKSDFDSEHIYFHNEKLRIGERPLLLSECGGFGYSIPGHRYDEKKSMGYGSVDNTKDLMAQIRKMYLEMIYPAIARGMCGLVYTQLCDVEEEINGIYTYDRQVCKVDPQEMRRMNQQCADILRETCR